VGSQRNRTVLTFLGQMSERLPQWVFERNIQLLLDSGAAAAALFATLLIRFEFRISPWFPHLLWWILVIAIARPLVLLSTKAYRSTWRHFHLADGFDLGLKSSLVTSAIIAFRLFHGFGLPVQALPVSVAIIELNLFILFAGGVRVLRRLTSTALHAANEPVYRTLLVSDEESLAGAVRLVEPYPDVQLAGIVTDEPRLQGHTVAGVAVLGRPESLEKLIIAHHIDLVLMASGGCKGAEEVVGTAAEFGAQVRILPTARDLVRGRVQVSHSLNAEQLVPRHQHLGADPHPHVVSCFEQRCVLVTGAGGSIGSEISRQVAQLPVSQLLLLDQDENSIFELMNELADARVPITPCVGDIRDAGLLQQIFSTHAPQVVLHAAAYKHVSVMEWNPCEAILNNVTGTRQLIEAAESFDCERFVMISTDKAVRPSCVMGASKRTAEALVQHRARHSAKELRTQFACVRFGNVVGSRGSVVPIFLRQIAAGGPVTVTHEQMTRYFMSIPQAVRLVLQSATLASNGDVYMLDMGDPVRIIDFARRLIRMSGLQPDTDIRIEIIGARPGEKLHEQLWCEDAEVSSTVFPYVFRVKARTLPHHVADQIATLERAAAGRAEAAEVRSLLESLPIDYISEQRVSLTFAKNGSGRVVESSPVAGDD
jgi:FlaA1/EpsC-like NDP-sugar epimerase